MTRIKKLKFAIMLAVLIAGTVGGARADSVTELKALLGDREGWEAEAAEGMDMDMGQMKMIQVSRSYSRSGETADALLMIGSIGMPMGMMAQQGNMESASGKFETADVDGFTVKMMRDKADDTGSIIVPLAEKHQQQSLFILSFEGLAVKEALAVARKFDWKAMQTAVQKHLK